MKGDMIEKYVMVADGFTIEELIQLDARDVAYGVVNVPGRNRTTPVADGVKNIPEVPGVVKIVRGSPTRQFIIDWHEKKQAKNVTVIRYDGAGQEIDRELWPNTELSRLGKEAYAAETPGYARQNVTFLPEDIIALPAEN
jgi:hypothetical protein